MPLMKLPYKVIVPPKVGQPYYSTRHKLVSVPVTAHRPPEEHQQLFVIPAEEHPNLKGLIQDWIFLVSRQEESNKEKLLPPIVSLQKIIYGDGKGLLAVYGNEVVGVALIEEGTPSVISSSPQYIGTPQEGFVKSSLEEYLNKDKNEDDREDNSSNEDKINSITSLEKAKVAYHEHNGYREHPVAVKYHSDYFMPEESGKVETLAHKVGWSGFPRELPEGEGVNELISRIEREGLLAGKYAGRGTKEFDAKFGRKPAVYSYSFRTWVEYGLSMEKVVRTVFIFLTPSLQKDTEVHDDSITHGIHPTRSQWRAARRMYGESMTHIKTPEFATLVDVPASNLVMGSDLLGRVVIPKDNIIRSEHLESALNKILQERQQAGILKAETAIHVWNPNEEPLEGHEDDAEEVDSISSFEKAKVAYHEHDGYQEHPVAVKDHAIYFSRVSQVSVPSETASVISRYKPTEILVHHPGLGGLPRVISEGGGIMGLLTRIKQQGLLAGEYASDSTKIFDVKFGRKPAVYTYSFDQWARSLGERVPGTSIRHTVFVFLTSSLQESTEVHEDKLTYGFSRNPKEEWWTARRQYGEDISHIKRAEFATLVDIPPSNIVLGSDLLSQIPIHEEVYRKEDIKNALISILKERQQANILKAATAIHVWNPNEEPLERERIEKSDIPLSVKALIQDDRGRILTLKDNEIKLWDLPGGHVDSEDKELLDSLRREVKEETGLDIESCAPFDLTGETEIGNDQHSVLFYKVIASGNVELSPEHDKYKWVNHEDLKNMSFGQFSDILDQAFIEKQYMMPCAVGEHQHPGMTYCHSVAQHHRFEHRKVGAGTEKYEEYTVPLPGSKEALEERIERYKRIQEDLKERAEEGGEEFTPSLSPEEEARRDESEAASYEELSPVTVGAISRVHYIDDTSLMEHLQRIYGKKALEQQIITEDAFTAEGQPLKYKVLKLTPSQVYVAHEIAAQIRRNALSRSGMPRKVKLQPVLASLEKMLPMLKDMPREYKKYIDFGNGFYYRFIRENPNFDTQEFQEYVVGYNQADRDSGELGDIVESEVRRLAEEWENLLNLEKSRIYVESPQEAPEGTVVLRGPRGGLYYEGERPTREFITTPSGSKVPPAWTNVWVTKNPQDKVQATGLDSKGRKVFIYSAKFVGRQRVAKFNRLKNFVKVYPKILERIKNDRDEFEEAAVLYLISQTGFRIGSEKETGAAIKAFGASTIRCSHVKVLDGEVAFDFIGKKGVRITKLVSNEWLSNRVSRVCKKAEDKLFNTDDNQTRKYLSSIPYGSKYTVKDFRTYMGTEAALKIIRTLPSPEGKSAFRKFRNTVGDGVAAVLGNTRTVALNSYIAPEIFAMYTEQFPGVIKKSLENPDQIVDFLETVFYDEEIEQEEPEENLDDGEDIEIEDEFETKEEITSESFPEAPKSIVLEPEMAIKSNNFPDPYSLDVYGWIDLQLAGVDIGGKQPYGSKIIGKNIEQHLYSTLQDAVEDYLSSLTGKETEFEAIEGIRSIISKWAEENLPIADKAFEDLFRRGFAAGVVAEGGKLGTSDKLAMEILQDGKYRIGNRIKLFGDSTIKDFSNIITQSYTPEGRFELKSLVEEMEKAVPAKRYELERVARTETAQVSNLGRLWGWEQDPDKDFYNYIWSSVPDNRQKEISKWRAAESPYSFPEIKFLWFSQEEFRNGRWHADQYNQRCAITRTPSDKAPIGNRFTGKESLFRKTIDIVF